MLSWSMLIGHMVDRSVDITGLGINVLSHLKSVSKLGDIFAKTLFLVNVLSCVGKQGNIFMILLAHTLSRRKGFILEHLESFWQTRSHCFRCEIFLNFLDTFLLLGKKIMFPQNNNVCR